MTCKLQPHICSIVLLQKPHDLDTAYTLGPLQEEVDLLGELKISSHLHSHVMQQIFRRGHTLPSPPVLTKTQAGGITDKKSLYSDVAQPAQDKLAALKAYRKAQGLCFGRGDKWAPGHKCAATIQLHVIQEL